jgi:hypothetical protein
LLVDVFALGFVGSSSITMNLSLIIGLYMALDFNLNLFHGLLLFFLDRILYLSTSSSEKLELGGTIFGTSYSTCIGFSSVSTISSS